ncbi:type I methionyl aminopeptidase [Candidatus Wolfebacteria bacterium]|nr:type I methionyl aminopeptidase [Candidatus Wolfebacteria bacterium]
MQWPHLYSSREIDDAFESGQILARILAELARVVAPGVSLFDLEQLARDRTKMHGARPAFLGYRPDGAERSFPAALCTSLNDVIVHGVPANYAVRSGDILKIDFGVVFNKFFADAAITIGVGQVSPDADRLIEATSNALSDAIREISPGKTLGDVGWAISEAARRYGVAVVGGLTGHGVGRALHEDPPVFNWGKRGEGLELRPGAIIAVEPMFSLGKSAIRQLKDESWATKDRSLAAHFEHTVAVTEKGCCVLTLLE